MTTVIVAICVAILCGFGTWQLERSQWKAGLLKDLAKNQNAPLLYLTAQPLTPDMQFRRVSIGLGCEAGPSRQRAGRNLQGESGFSHLTNCERALLRGQSQPKFQLDAGWTARPDKQPLPRLHGRMVGRLISDNQGGWILVSEDAAPGLEPSAPPGFETITNNHMSYAIQWFSFATILLVIYGIWLRRWLAPPAKAA